MLLAMKEEIIQPKKLPFAKINYQGKGLFGSCWAANLAKNIRKFLTCCLMPVRYQYLQNTSSELCIFHYERNKSQFPYWAAMEASLSNSSVTVLLCLHTIFSHYNSNHFPSSNNQRLLTISVGTAALFSYQMHQSHTYVTASGLFRHCCFTGSRICVHLFLRCCSLLHKSNNLECLGDEMNDRPFQSLHKLVWWMKKVLQASGDGLLAASVL